MNCIVFDQTALCLFCVMTRSALVVIVSLCGTGTSLFIFVNELIVKGSADLFVSAAFLHSDIKYVCSPINR